ncbi:Protein REDUCED WALL ACETYLATION 2 [Zea mays]|uniref:Protein REDUCED WALL ACETYLATION 2 n=1 Tax=Zea mays TaxID=4577 RepID=A0A1D6IFQ5_MAIZE|nr:Protein REDUCED WALL ACETYLATION 2 [Zea mays]
MDDSSVKAEEQTMLLEEGGQAMAAKPAYTSLTSQILRLIFMDQLLLLENRLTLRAISKFGGYLLYFYICDRANLLGESAKNYNRDLFLFLYFLLFIVATMTSFKVHQDKSSFTGKSVLYFNRHQTEEWKGWMQVLTRTCMTADQGSSGSPSATCPYDVYCFGKVLLELVTGRLGISASNDASTSE